MLSTQNRTKARTKVPISNHPLFPAIVALWFGALFGLGSLAIRPSILESLVLSSHLDVILPMTAPPLGMTARILLALTMAVIGIAIGAVIARRIARPKPVARQRRRGANNVTGKARGRADNAFSAAPQRQPEPQAALEPSPPARRRALAIEPEERDDYRLHAAPLPGGSPSIFDVTQIDMAGPETASPQATAPVQEVPEQTGPEQTGPEQAGPAAEPQPFELASYAEPESAIAEQVLRNDVTLPEQDNCLVLDELVEAPAPRQVFGQPQQVTDEVPAPAAAAAVVPAAESVASAPALAEAEPAPRAGLVLPQDSAAQRISSANLAELSPVELIERFALALQHRRSSGALPTGLVEAAASFAPPAPVDETFTAPVATAPLGASAPAMTPAPVDEPQLPVIPGGFVEVEVEAEDDRIYPTSSPLSLPAALRPINFSEYEDLDDHNGFVPPRSISMPAAAEVAAPTDEPAFGAPVAEAVAQTEIEPEADVLEEGYSSLLDLNRPAPLRQSFVRIEEPATESAQVEPVVIFPGQDARAGLRFARPVEPQPSAESAPVVQTAPQSGVTTLRRFDAPSASAPAAGSNPAPAQDPAEAERALRSALATLQRMSGAA